MASATIFQDITVSASAFFTLRNGEWATLIVESTYEGEGVQHRSFQGSLRIDVDDHAGLLMREEALVQSAQSRTKWEMKILVSKTVYQERMANVS